MIKCLGDGECLVQCVCECGPECESGCECDDGCDCDQKLPKRILDCNNGMCIGCAVQMGRHVLSSEFEECCVCLENKPMIILKCEHRVCNDCWFNITEIDFGKGLCPLCRNINDWS